MSAERAAGLVRGWVSLYTRGLPAQIRQDRCDEIDDDLRSQIGDSMEPGQADRSVTWEVVLRLVFGIPADLSWRAEQRRVAHTHVAPERIPTTGTRAIALLAIAGGVGWVIWPIPQAVYGEAGWAIAPVSWLLFLSVVFGTWALAGATVGLIFSFQDRIRGGPALLGSLGASVGAISVFGLFGGILALPLGSAVLAWDLGRAGILDRWPARAHVASAIILFIPIVAILANNAILEDRATAVPLITLVLPYAVSWIVIGWSFRHGASAPARPVDKAS